MRKYGQGQRGNTGEYEYRHQNKEWTEGRKHYGEGRHGEGGHSEGGHSEGGHSEGDNRKGRHGGRRGNGYLSLAEPEGTHLLFIGSRSCFRHKGTQKMQLLQEGRLSFLCVDEIDWITGAYLNLIEQAAEELIQDLKPKHLVLFGGCQIELLSTDYESITKGLSEQYAVDVHFHRGCHLIGYGEALEEKQKEKERQ